MFAGFVFALVTLAIAHQIIAASLRKDAAVLIWPMTAVASWLLFSLAFRESWFWGLASIQLFLLNLTTVFALWILATRPNDWSAFAAAIGAAVIATFSEASGLALWATGSAAIWLNGNLDGRRNKRMVLWTSGAAVTAVSYAWGLDWEGSAV